MPPYYLVVFEANSAELLLPLCQLHEKAGDIHKLIGAKLEIVALRLYVYRLVDQELSDILLDEGALLELNAPADGVEVA